MAELGPTTIFGDLIINGSIGGAIRVAFVKTTPTTGNEVVVYLDVDTTGEEVTVTCSIVDETDLDASTPTLTDGDTIFVGKIGGTWYCLSLFYAT